MKTELSTEQFEAGYAPRWDNDKFRIGPSFAYERLDVKFTLTNLTLDAKPPTSQRVDLPNNIFLVGADFDHMPSQKFDLYGKFGAVPCCGGGWHVFETEFGAKHYFTHHINMVGGVRYSYLKRDFNLPAETIEVTGETIGPFSGFLKTPGFGPFVGMSYRF